MNQLLASQTLLGMAIGDHLGCLRKHRPKFVCGQRTPWENVEDIGEGGVHGIPPGGYSANTVFARCLAQSLTMNLGKVEPEDILERYRQAIDVGLFCPVQGNGELDIEAEGQFKLGPVNLTAGSLGADPVIVQAVERWSVDRQAHQERSALSQFVLELIGKGPKVQPAPGLDAENSSSCLALTIPMAIAGCCDDLIRRAIGVTHGSEYALACSIALAGLFRTITERANSATDWKTVYAMWRPEYCPSIVAHREAEEELMNTRHIVYALEAALFCLNQTESFKEAVLLAANLGGYSDTVGAVVGAVAGCFYTNYNLVDGKDRRIPANDYWKMKIYQGPEICIQAERLSDISKKSP